MKIACLGNMNNILFQIGRYLIDAKHDVTFFLFDEFDHFLPEADTYEDIRKFNIVKLGWNFEQFFGTSCDEIKTMLVDKEFLIGTDLSPAYLWKAGLRLDIYFPHGNDLYDYAFPRYKNFPPQLWEIVPHIIGSFQREGISQANYVSLDPSEEVYEAPLRRIRGDSGKRVDSPPFLYLKQYTTENVNTTKMYGQFKELRNKYKFIVFQHGSQDWSSRGPFKINKGNDVLIKGFAEYLNTSNAFKDSVLVLVEYGTDVEKSKTLIRDLGISDNVIWLPKMLRKDIMCVISHSDICVGELGPRHWFSYSCIFEFMAMKKPLIHHRNDAYFSAKGIELYPMIDAHTVEKLSETFRDININKEKYRLMGEQAHEWLLRRTEKCLKNILEILELKREKQLNENHVSFFETKKVFFYLRPDLIYAYFFLFYQNLKLSIKGWLLAR